MFWVSLAIEGSEIDCPKIAKFNLGDGIYISRKRYKNGPEKYNLRNGTLRDPLALLAPPFMADSHEGRRNRTYSVGICTALTDMHSTDAPLGG